ncbi:MAG: hypothetical protein EBS13_06995 [Verrucomicrobia bacterium]|nr:hypothetical protein [Verrucomicrobiota bacterium]
MWILHFHIPSILSTHPASVHGKTPTAWLLQSLMKHSFHLMKAGTVAPLANWEQSLEFMKMWKGYHS